MVRWYHPNDGRRPIMSDRNEESSIINPSSIIIRTVHILYSICSKTGLFHSRVKDLFMATKKMSAATKTKRQHNKPQRRQELSLESNQTYSSIAKSICTWPLDPRQRLLWLAALEVHLALGRRHAFLDWLWLDRVCLVSPLRLQL